MDPAHLENARAATTAERKIDRAPATAAAAIL
jgi:hypothetical protein